MPQSNEGSQALYRYLYRAHKPKYRYHISIGTGAACNLQNSDAFKRIDTVADSPPPGRMLCQMCAQALGLPTPVPSGAPVTPSDEPPLPHKIIRRADKLLAHFGVSMYRDSPGFKETSIRVVQEQFRKYYGCECPGLTWEKARSVLGDLKSRGYVNHPGGKGKPKRAELMLGSPDYMALAKASRERQAAKASKKQTQKAAMKPPKPQKAPKKPKDKESNSAPSRHGLSAERVAYIISDAFLQSYEWRSLRYECLKMNDGRCELCGMGNPHGLVLRVDHIKSRRLYPELALVLSNLQCLCDPCNHGKGFRDKTDWRRKPLLDPAESDIPWDRYESF